LFKSERKLIYRDIGILGGDQKRSQWGTNIGRLVGDQVQHWASIIRVVYYDIAIFGTAAVDLVFAVAAFDVDAAFVTWIDDELVISGSTIEIVGATAAGECVAIIGDVDGIESVDVQLVVTDVAVIASRI
jgi:hypothetical protein